MFEEILNNIGIVIFMIIFFTFCFTAVILDEKFGIFRKLKKRQQKILSLNKSLTYCNKIFQINQGGIKMEMCMKCIHFTWKNDGYCHYHNRETVDSSFCEEYDGF